MDHELSFRYLFKFGNGREKVFELHLDRDSLDLVRCSEDKAPPWTKLTFVQCPNCPLDATKHESCPVAVNLSDVIIFFKPFISHEEVEILIETERRGFIKKTSLQAGLSSLIGLTMATSGCPVLNKLKPMVRHHLPFANAEETEYRAMSMYLLAQYFIQKRGGQPDWKLKNLTEIYDEIHQVNKSFCQRLKNIPGEDALPNAIVILDTFANNILFSLNQNSLERLEKIFSAYF